MEGGEEDDLYVFKNSQQNEVVCERGEGREMMRWRDELGREREGGREGREERSSSPSTFPSFVSPSPRFPLPKEVGWAFTSNLCHLKKELPKK